MSRIGDAFNPMLDSIQLVVSSQKGRGQNTLPNPVHEDCHLPPGLWGWTYEPPTDGLDEVHLRTQIEGSTKLVGSFTWANATAASSPPGISTEFPISVPAFTFNRVFIRITVTRNKIDGYQADLAMVAEWRGSGGNTLGSTTRTVAASYMEQTVAIDFGTPPAGTVGVRLTLKTTNYPVGALYKRTGEIAFRGVSVSFNGTPIVTRQWQDLAAKAGEIKIHREALNTGTLTATVSGDLVDQYADGDLIRVNALSVDSVWEPIFTGTISNITAAYNGRGKAVTTITAVDATARLASTPRHTSVSEEYFLQEIMHGSGIPHKIYFSDYNAIDIYRGAQPLAKNESASAIDQIALLSDSMPDHLACIDRRGVLRWTEGHSGNVFGDIDASVYSDIEVGRNLDSCINSVIVNELKYDPATGETEEVRSGPFQNAESVARWGAREVEFTVVLSDPSGPLTPSAFAAVILAKNSNPELTVESVIVPIKQVSGHALADINNLAQVGYTPRGIWQPLIISQIEHTITPKGWITQFGFRKPESVAAPTLQPALIATPDELPPYARRERISSTQSLPSGTWTAINFSTAGEQSGGIEWDDVNWRFTVAKAGIYLICAGVRFTGHVTGTRGISIDRNGNRAACAYAPAPAATTIHSGPTVSTLLRLAAGDTVSVRGLQNSGAALNIVSNSEPGTFVTITRTGA